MKQIQILLKNGIISDSEANSLLMRNIVTLHNQLNNKFDIFKDLNPNQKTALISFAYNLGINFFETDAKKLNRTFKKW